MIFDEEKIPHNLTNEQTIIVAACNDKEHWFLISQSINEDDFYSAKHRKIFAVIKRLYDKKIDIDFEFLCQFLNDNNLAESVGGNDYLLFMLKNSICISSEHNLKIYIDAMRSSSIERKLLKAVNEARGKILVKDGTTTNEILAKLENGIMAISHQKNIDDGLMAFDSSQLMKEFIDKQGQAMTLEDGQLTGIDTGLSALNEATDGFQACDLIYVGARPSMGKTTLGMNFVKEALFKQELPVVVFSMESPRYQIFQRLIASMSDVFYSKIKKADYSELDSVRVNNAIARIKNRKLIICDKGGLSPSDMRTILRQVQREHGGIGLIMADYVQKMQLKAFANDANRNNELSIISADLKEIAKEYKCPFVCLAQLSKACEQRPNKRPLMSDLRDCGGLEQDADVVIMLYRNEVYYPKDAESKGLAELIVCKNRNGATGTIMTRFNGPVFRFENMPNENDAF